MRLGFPTDQLGEDVAGVGPRGARSDPLAAIAAHEPFLDQRRHLGDQPNRLGLPGLAADRLPVVVPEQADCRPEGFGQRQMKRQ